MHEGTHYLLFKNRRLNAVVSELFLAWPLFITTQTYRGGHFAHHRHVNTEEDPDLMRKQRSASEWEFPTSWGALVALLAKDVLGLNTRQLVSDFDDMWDQNATKKEGIDFYLVARDPLLHPRSERCHLFPPVADVPAALGGTDSDLAKDDHAHPQHCGALRDRKRPCVYTEPDDAPIFPRARLRGSATRQLPSRTSSLSQRPLLPSAATARGADEGCRSSSPGRISRRRIGASFGNAWAAADKRATVSEA